MSQFYDGSTWIPKPNKNTIKEMKLKKIHTIKQD